MTEINPPAFLQNRTDHSAAIDRGAFSALAESCVLTSSDFSVSQRAAGANMSVDVNNGGTAFIEGTEATNQGYYSCLGDASAVNLTIGASSPSLSRIDIVVAQVEDSFYSGSTDAWSLAVVAGTPASSPVAPSAPDNSIVLAEVLIGVSVTSIVDANITDKRVIAHGGLYSGPYSCTSTTRPDNPWYGMHIIETDTDKEYVWKNAWEFMPSAVSAGYLLTQTGEVSPTSDLTLTTSETDVSGASINFTTTRANAKYEAILCCEFHVQTTSAGNTASGKIYVDGSSAGNPAFLNLDSITRLMSVAVARGTLASTGSHTFKIRGYKVSSGGSALIRSYSTLAVKIWED